MDIRVKLFAVFRDRAGGPEITVTLPDRSTAAEVLSAVTARFPDLAHIAARAAVAVNFDTVERSTIIQPGDEVAVIPPVSGGSI